MFKDIVTKERVTFKDLEEITFKIACEFANEMLKNMLEEYDKQIMESRDKTKYRHKGIETTTLKVKTGLVQYSRVKYLENQEDGTKKCKYLIDELLEINKIGQFSSGLIELIVKNISEVSYRACAETINSFTGITVSGAGIWQIIQKLGEEIKTYEKEKVETYEDDKLEAGTKETLVVYQEADGIMICTQGKDRKEHIEKYKKEHPDEEVPKKVRNIEIKLGMTYEGWKKVAMNRYELVGKEYVSGYMTGEDMANITNANLHSKYNMEKVELRVLNSDGGSWIKKLLVTGTIYQADSYHIKEKINTQVKDLEDAEKLKEMFWKKEYSEMIEYVEDLKYKYNGEYEEINKLEELKRYLEKRKESMKRYNDNEEIKKKLKSFNKQTGLKYRNMGCQESNNYSILTRRFKRRRMSWSKNGSENLAKVITTYASESCTDIIKHFNIQKLPESFIEYSEKYIKQIEENIEKMKKEKVKTKKIYTFKQGNIEGCPEIKEIIKNKPISELIYR